RTLSSSLSPASPRRPRTRLRPGAEVLEGRQLLSTLVVDNNPAYQAPYTTIQAAVDAAKSGDTISVAPGIYTEQVTVPVGKNNLTIMSQQLGAAEIAAPATLTGAADIVRISAKAVTLENFTISGPSDGIDAGVRIDGGGSATVRDNLITQIYGSIFGAGLGVGVLITDGNGTISDNTITQYEKGGIVAEGASSSASIANNLVVGVGPNSVIGQNGIQISNGARASIVNNDVSQNIFSPQTFVAAGILLFNAGPTTVVDNTAAQNDVGILVSGTKGATLFNNDLSDSTFDGIELRDGTTHTVVSFNYSHDNQLDGIYIDATATNNTITRNQLTQNSNFDAEDLSTGNGTAGTANTWSRNNVFTESSPSGLW
ncbi:MAG TPA: right-handed parallel beta-helix repeat-containing protein, partial [Isosphaeraceae bacterium]|nr:right-handed parallel beta-helix repeat-containing protein [Isosphaeraceae bacterium]